MTLCGKLSPLGSDVALTNMGTQGVALAVMGTCAVLGACSGRLTALESQDGATPSGDAPTTSTGSGGGASGSGGSTSGGSGGTTGSGGSTSGGSGGAMTGGSGGTAGGATDASSGAGGVSTGGTAGGGSGGAAGSAGSPVADVACAGRAYEVKVVPRALLIVANSSRTMDCPWGVPSPGCNDFDAGPAAGPTRWSVMSDAINQAATYLESRGAALGLLFSPRIVSEGGTGCLPGHYDIGVDLPGSAGGIFNVLARRPREGASLLALPLEGAILHAKGRANVATVFDGESDFQPCADDTIDRAELIASTGVAANPPTLTTVIGIGSDLTDLHRVAKAGGTPQAHLISTGLSVGDATQQLAYALREAATPCEFAIPSEIDADGGFEPTRINVRTLYSSFGVWKEQYNVPGASSCKQDGFSDGWYYDDAAKPTKVILCQTTCQSLALGDAPAVAFVDGCPTTHRPPPN
jgi:hypothetical protein